MYRFTVSKEVEREELKGWLNDNTTTHRVQSEIRYRDAVGIKAQKMFEKDQDAHWNRVQRRKKRMVELGLLSRTYFAKSPFNIDPADYIAIAIDAELNKIRLEVPVKAESCWLVYVEDPKEAMLAKLTWMGR
jgi:hypothetical protein